MFFQEAVGVVAAVVGVCAFVPYILAIFGRDLTLRRIHCTKPERVTWVIWFVLGAELLAMNYLLGARESLPLIAAYTVAYLIISVLSVWRGIGGWTRLNGVCFFGGVLGAGVWVVLKLHGSEEWAAVGAIIISGIADILAFIPTIRHAWLQPYEENRTGWTIGFCGAVLNLFAVTHTLGVSGFAVAFFPVYNALLMGAIVLSVWFSPHRLGVRGLKPV